MKKPAYLIAAVLLCAQPAYACRPDVDYLRLSFLEKIGNNQKVFLGKVVSLTPTSFEDAGTITFNIISSRTDYKPGETVTLEYKDYGSCGIIAFKTGEIWLYAGDVPFGPTTLTQPDDLGADGGKDFEAVLTRISQRLTAKTDQ